MGHNKSLIGPRWETSEAHLSPFCFTPRSAGQNVECEGRGLKCSSKAVKLSIKRSFFNKTQLDVAFIHPKGNSQLPASRFKSTPTKIRVFLVV